MMEQAVEDGGGEDLIAQQFCPLRKGLMAGQDHAPALVAATDQLEEVVGFRSIQAEIAHLIHRPYGRLHRGLQLMRELVVLLRCLKVRHEVIQGGEVERAAVLAGSDGQGNRSRGLAGPRRAQDDCMGFWLDAPQGGQFLDANRVEVGLEGQVEPIQGFGIGQAGQLERLLKATPFTHPHFFLKHEVEARPIASLALLCPRD